MPSRTAAQPITAGLVAAFVGFASSFAVVLKGLTAVGATDAQAASGLMALSVAMGIAGIVLSIGLRMPVFAAWSTPGAALLAATGPTPGGFPRCCRRLRRGRDPSDRGRALSGRSGVSSQPFLIRSPTPCWPGSCSAFA